MPALECGFGQLYPHPATLKKPNLSKKPPDNMVGFFCRLFLRSAPPISQEVQHILTNSKPQRKGAGLGGASVRAVRATPIPRNIKTPSLEPLWCGGGIRPQTPYAPPKPSPFFTSVGGGRNAPTAYRLKAPFCSIRCLRLKIKK